MMQARRRALLCMLALCASGAAIAHRFHVGLAEITFNERTGSVEVVHTYMSHDLDALLAQAQRRPVDLAQPEDEALLRAYIERRFQLQGHDEARLPLKWVGVTLSPESVIIYQELEQTPLSQVARVRNQVLVDFLPRQVNTVNVRRDGKITSLSFDRKNAERHLR